MEAQGGLELIASTRTSNKARKHINVLPDEPHYFKSLQWTPDGTTLISSSADYTLRAFVVPLNLLSPLESPLQLAQYTTLPGAEPISSLAPYPYFNLQDPSTTLLLSCPRDHPIRLSNILIPSPSDPTYQTYSTAHSSAPANPITATYPLISITTEAFLTPSSLTWCSSGTSFLAGTDSLISMFDASRPGEGPVIRFPTIPSKRCKLKGGGVGMKGIISALSIQPSSSATELTEDGILAAGTWTRSVGLYDAGGMGGTVATWSIASAADEIAKIGGAGVSQVRWSPCGRYLVVVERKSRGCLIYDVRYTRELVGWAEGREAMTNQRLAVDVVPGGQRIMPTNREGEEMRSPTALDSGNAADNGAEIWAGGTDGVARVWRGVGTWEGKRAPDWEWKAHEDPVSSVAVHPTRTVVATCSGQRAVPGLFADASDSSEEDSDSSEDDSDSSSDSSTSVGESPRSLDNSIRIWKL